ncbi:MULTISPECIES: hypothetical protein [Microbacterium]|uniref:hypothetical protein n=1 Tax=Microbacterium TaxID=33882 RepID=UPI000B892D47|nr:MULTISPECIES: hypothetical protein [Microbacterium]NJI59259.1 hypothetical protein [Microbacterium sp. B19(2022)]
MPRPTFLGGWWPAILFFASLLLAAITRIDPWIIGISTASLILIGFGVEWWAQQSRRQKPPA